MMVTGWKLFFLCPEMVIATSTEGFLVTYLNYRSYPKVLKLFSGARKLAVSLVDLRQNFLPPSVQVFQVSFESLRWLFSGSFGDEVLPSVVDVLETCCPFSQLAPHVLTTRTNRQTIIRIILQHVIKHRYRDNQLSVETRSVLQNYNSAHFPDF